MELAQSKYLRFSPIFLAVNYTEKRKKNNQVFVIALHGQRPDHALHMGFAYMGASEINVMHYLLV